MSKVDSFAHRMSTTQSPPVSVVETPFYETEKRFEADDINGYDSVLFTVCDLYGRPRGKFAVGRGIQRFVKEGMEMPHSKLFLSP